MVIKQSKKYSLVAASIGICALIAFGFYYGTRTCEGIQPYDAARDRAFVIQLFKDNWDWLIASENYSVEFMLDNRASSQDLTTAGNLQLYTMCSHGKPVGFTAFYKKSFFKTQVLFLAVPENERRKGYAEQLLLFDLAEIKRQGISLVQILTRIDNFRAQNLYKKVGFKEYWRDDRFVRLEIKI